MFFNTSSVSKEVIKLSSTTQTFHQRQFFITTKLALPGVARLYVPAVACPRCNYPNDSSFNFCQMCGYQRSKTRKLSHHLPPKYSLNAIDTRLSDLNTAAVSTPYSKQKSSLRSELESFLHSLPGNKTIFSATPRDVCRFLVWKDHKGKTKVHGSDCSYQGQSGTSPCACPTRLSYNTVDSYIGKLRAVFQEAGCKGDWISRLSAGNPAADPEVKRYLRSITCEQLQARVIPKQAVPLFIQKLLQLSRFLENKLESDALRHKDIFIIGRDLAYFKLLFFSGDRGGDLGQLKSPEIIRFPDDTGFLFNHIWGNTLRGGNANVFGVRRHPNLDVCPIRAIENHVSMSSKLGLDLTTGYLFRPTDRKGMVSNSPLASSTAESRLRCYLKEWNIDEGETLHSFRAGCAITLALTGSPLADIMSHVGWHSPKTANCYMKIAHVLRSEGPSEILASIDPLQSAPTDHYLDLNTLKCFVCAFPPRALKRHNSR